MSAARELAQEVRVTADRVRQLRAMLALAEAEAARAADAWERHIAATV